MNDSHRNSIISVIAVLFLIGAASLHAALQDSRKEVETLKEQVSDSVHQLFQANYDLCVRDNPPTIKEDRHIIDLSGLRSNLTNEATGNSVRVECYTGTYDTCTLSTVPSEHSSRYSYVFADLGPVLFNNTRITNDQLDLRCIDDKAEKCSIAFKYESNPCGKRP